MQDLVLIPGLNNTAAVFDDVMRLLPSHVKAHALDLAPLEEVEAIADAVLAQLPAQFWLCGFSFGAYVGLAILERAPHRVLGFALVCSSPAADSDAQLMARRAAIQKAQGGHYIELVAAQASHAFHPQSLKDHALMDRRMAMVTEYGAQRFVAHQRAAMARSDRRKVLDGTRPTLVVAGEMDPLFTPSSLRELAQTIPDCQFEVVEAAAHLVPMEQPARLAIMLAGWIDGQTTTPTGKPIFEARPTHSKAY